MSLFRVIKELFIYSFDLFFEFLFWLFLSPKKITSAQKRIAVIRMDAIGDFALSLSSLSHLFDRYKKEGTHLTLIGNSSWTDLAQFTGYFDEIVPLDRPFFWTSLRNRWQGLKKLWHLSRFEVVLYPVYSRGFSEGDLIVRFLKAKQKIAFLGDSNNAHPLLKQVGNGFYTRLIPVQNPDNQIIHEHELQCQFVDAMLSTSIRRTVLDLRERFKSIDTSQFALPEKYIALFPEASVSGKEWPAENWIELCQKLNSEFQLPLVLLGAKQKMEITSRLSQLKIANVNLFQKTNLTELFQIIANADFLISNDTSAIHFAALSKTKSICLLGGGHFGRFLPYPENSQTEISVAYVSMPCFHCSWHCIYKREPNDAFPCIQKIEVESVLKLMLKESTKSS